MTNIIEVENLSKRYLVGHQVDMGRYVALRDVIARGAREFVRKAADMARGRQIIQGDEVEEFWALKDVSFKVKQGEVLGIIGRNGAGKSTLLKILSRITDPTEGRVVIRGRVASLLEVGTGFHPELTGRENIYLNGAILGMTQREIKRKFDEIVAFAEIEQFLDTPVKRYSSGMYVRLAFSVAAHLEPEILIVDEVLAVGDLEFQQKSLGKMQNVSGKDGRTVLFVSHNLAAIETLCKQVICLAGGRISAMGQCSTVITDYMRRNAEQSRKSLKDGTSRYIRSLVVKGADGRTRDVFGIGENIIFEVKLHSDTLIDHPRFSIVILTPRGEPLATLHTDVQQKSNWAFRGAKSLRAVWKGVPLNVGSYRVDVHLGGHGYEIESLVDCATLEIQARDVYRTGSLPDPASEGYLVPDASWEMRLEEMRQLEDDKISS
jgi:homopolymeric O-antigen transport system ATP-binding protein